MSAGLSLAFASDLFTLRLICMSRSGYPLVVGKHGCISMQRYWSSRRYFTLRTLVLLAADFSSSTNWQPDLGNAPPRSTV